MVGIVSTYICRVGVSRVGQPLIAVYGFNHKCLSVKYRESFAFTPTEKHALLKHLLASPLIAEAAVINTCNRVELVLSSKSGLKPAAMISAELEKELHATFMLKAPAALRNEQLLSSLERLENEAAVSHLFRLACGLESLVLGETQILAQLKQSYNFARDCGCLSTVMHKLFHRAFNVAKLVRTQTGLGTNALSVAYLGRELVARVFGDFQDLTVLCLGAGETGALALKHFISAGVKKIILANKSEARAQALCSSYTQLGLSARFIRLAEIETVLGEADVVIGASGVDAAGMYFVNREMLDRAHRKRAAGPQVFLDLAVPRNFSADLGAVPDVFVYDMDDLGRFVEENLNERQAQALQAEAIVEAEVKRFSLWLNKRRAEGPIKKVGEMYDSYERLEFEKSLRRLARLGLSREQELAIEEIFKGYTQGLRAKLLHQPFTSLKDRIERTIVEDNELEEGGIKLQSKVETLVRNFENIFLGKRFLG